MGKYRFHVQGHPMWLMSPDNMSIQEVQPGHVLQLIFLRMQAKPSGLHFTFMQEMAMFIRMRVPAGYIDDISLVTGTSDF